MKSEVTCPVCSKRFSRPGYLERHMRLHMDVSQLTGIRASAPEGIRGYQALPEASPVTIVAPKGSNLAGSATAGVSPAVDLTATTAVNTGKARAAYAAGEPEAGEPPPPAAMLAVEHTEALAPLVLLPGASLSAAAAGTSTQLSSWCQHSADMVVDGLGKTIALVNVTVGYRLGAAEFAAGKTEPL
jgi:hypothetical protein